MAYLSPFSSPSKTPCKTVVSPPLPLASKLSPSDLGETGAVVSPPHPQGGWGRGGETSSFSRDFRGDTKGGHQRGTGSGGGETCPAPPSRGGWCQITCPLDRRPRSLFDLWLRNYQAEGRPDGQARDLARRTCRALYPEDSR